MNINIYGWIIIGTLLIKSGVYIGQMPDKRLSKLIGALIGSLIEFLILLKALSIF